MAVRGKIFVDDGAKKALITGNKSLLASGITTCEGKFIHGSGVELCGIDKIPFAKGITNYDSDEILLVKGKKSSEIRKIIGDSFYEEVIHRDNLILL